MYLTNTLLRGTPHDKYHRIGEKKLRNSTLQIPQDRGKN